MNQSKWEMFTALDKDGFYWDERIGKCLYPEAFVNEQAARHHAGVVRERWNVVVRPVKVSLSVTGGK